MSAVAKTAKKFLAPITSIFSPPPLPPPLPPQIIRVPTPVPAAASTPPPPPPSVPLQVAAPKPPNAPIQVAASSGLSMSRGGRPGGGTAALQLTKLGKIGASIQRKSLLGG